MQNLQVVEVKGQRVLTTQQIAECYETTTQLLKNNFNYNKHRYKEGKHYISIQGEELRQFKARFEIQTNLKYAHILYLWTEKGALLHAKSLNTDKAWEVYDYLVDFYFRSKEETTLPVSVKKEYPKAPLALPKQEIAKKEETKESQDAISTFKVLIQIAEAKGITIKTKELTIYKSRLKGDKIAVRSGMSLEEVNYEIAFELYHAMVNYNHGNMITSPLAKYYNEQAERAATMIIQLLNTNIKTA